MQSARIVRWALVAGLLLGAACSGGGLSKEEFIEQADAFCKEADEKTQELEPPRTPAELDDFVEQARSISIELLDDLRGLEPPEEDQETIDRMLTRIEEAVDYLPQIQEAARQRDSAEIGRLGQELQATASEANEIAQEYGLQQCGRTQPAPAP